MKGKDVREERRRLEEEIERTREELDRLREYLRQEVDTSLDEGDPDLHEREKNLALMRSLEHRLSSLEQALAMLEKGTYGICQRCGKRIDPARLEALPEATLCLKCQIEVERLVRRGLTMRRERLFEL